VSPVHFRTASFGDAFELRITLRDIKPIIWRRIRVPTAAPLGILHDVLQVAFGWSNSHLHDFYIGEIRFGVVDDEEENFLVDENAAPLGAVAQVGSRFIYRYDYGDEWEHDVKVLRLTDESNETFVCTGGARACPPEDCGGAGGYAQLLKVLADKSDDEHAAMQQRVGRGFDPERFDVAAVNKKLAALARRLGRHRSLMN